MMRKISKAFFGVEEDDQEFNLPAAIDAYQTIMKLDDEEAVMTVVAALMDDLPRDMYANRDEINAVIEYQAEQRLNTLKRRVVSKAMSKRLDGENVVDERALANAIALVEIYKADRRYKRGGNPKNRGQFSETWGPFGQGPRRREWAASNFGPGGQVYTNMPGKTWEQKFENWDKIESKDFPTTSRAYRRIGLASDLVETSLGPTLPAKAQLALRTGQWVGHHGKEAERVLGPSIRRSAYRYRGIERTPEPGLQREIAGATRQFKSSNEAREHLVYGMTNRMTGDFTESPLIHYFARRLPDPQRVHLQYKSGIIPPSEGVIIDRSGKIVTQAVGYGEDWYLPFNLKNLKALQGGEYIRTRVLGGPTTEDIYTGLMTGARSITVVSNSGVFTMEFDDTFRGGRRFNDKAVRMVNRYGALLDAVKGGNVTQGSLDPATKQRIAERAFRMFPDDPKARGDWEQREKAKEEFSPQLSPQRKEALTQDFLERKAARFEHPDGMPMNVEEMVSTKIDTDTKALMAEYDGMDEATARNAAQQRYSTTDGIIDQLGLRREYTQYMERERSKYANSLKPLRLDGQGYAQSLEALREQFPYYIARVEVRGLPNVEPVRTATTRRLSPSPSEKDYGYIKPRFIRPEKAQAGYYDETIGGGKISADKLYQQNRKWAKPEATTKTKKEEEGEEKKPPTSRTATDADKRVLMSELLENVNSQQLTAPAKIGGTGNKEYWANLGADAQAIFKQHYPMLFMTQHDLDQEVRARGINEVFKTMTDSAKRAHEDGAIALHPDLQARIDTGGGTAPSRNFQQAVKNWTVSPTDNYDFGPDFEPGLDPEDYEEAYNYHPELEAVKQAYGESLAALKVKELSDDIAKLNRLYMEDNATSGSYPLLGSTPKMTNPLTGKKFVDYPEVEQTLEALTKANQLKRLYQRAQLKPKPESYDTGLTPGFPDDLVTVHGATPQQAEKWEEIVGSHGTRVRRLGEIENGPSQVISGDLANAVREGQKQAR